MTNIIQFPSGRFGFVGNLPAPLGDKVSATKEDVMAGRAWRDEDGTTVTIKFPSFTTREEAIEHMRSRGLLEPGS